MNYTIFNEQLVAVITHKYLPGKKYARPFKSMHDKIITLPFNTINIVWGEIECLFFISFFDLIITTGKIDLIKAFGGYFANVIYTYMRIALALIEKSMILRNSKQVLLREKGCH